VDRQVDLICAGGARFSERARSYSINADSAPADGYEAALDRLSPDWREHLARA
jgi:hypothetical protein